MKKKPKRHSIYSQKYSKKNIGYIYIYLDYVKTGAENMNKGGVKRKGRKNFDCPFPVITYFGGKSKVADIVWRAIGQPAHYIEPFFGSGAVLLARPNFNPQKHVETINDKDGFVCNVWRALQADPDAVAKICDWPVNHADLCAPE